MRKWMFGSLAVGLLAVAACGDDAPPPVVPSNAPPPPTSSAPEPPPPPPDGDKDGVVDADDKCPTEAGPAENKGCPWPKLSVVVEEFFKTFPKAVADKDAAAFKAHYADGAKRVIVGMGTFDDPSQPEAMLNGASSDRKMAVSRAFVNEGTREVLLEWVTAGTHTGEFMGHKPAKAAKKFGVMGATRFKFAMNGKLEGSTCYMDLKTMVDQITGKGGVRAPAALPASMEGPVAAASGNSGTISDVFGKVVGPKLDKDYGKLFAKDVSFDDLTAAGAKKGPGEATKWANGLLGGFKDVKVNVGEVWTAGDWVVNFGDWAGTQSGTFMGVGAKAKDREAVKVSFAGVFKLADNKVAKATLYSNAVEWYGKSTGKPLAAAPKK